MSLALIGPQSLDKLQQLAVTNFAKVPTTTPPLPPSSDEYDGLPLPFRPAEASPVATLMVPVNELRSLKVVWCVRVTDLPQWLDSKPEELWELLLRNRAKGGLLPLLKKRGLASSLEAGVEEFTRSWILLSVDVNLTPLGLTKWRAVSSLLFAYLRTLASSGVPSYLVEEFRSLAKTSFTYAEPQEVTLTRQPQPSPYAEPHDVSSYRAPLSRLSPSHSPPFDAPLLTRCVHSCAQPQSFAESASTSLQFYPPEQCSPGRASSATAPRSAASTCSSTAPTRVTP